MAEYYYKIPSPIGELYCTFRDDSLISISLSKPGIKLSSAPEIIKQQLKEYFSGKRKQFDLQYEFAIGTEFEQKVWLTLLRIPYAETRTYKWIAEAIGNPKSARAVGQALSKNPVPIILACHRIIESDGKLGGFGLGTDIKRRLLSLEHYNSKS